MASNASRKVRVVAKIRAFTGPESKSFNELSKPWISVHKPKGESSESVTICFSDQPNSRKGSHEVDYCYEPNESNSTIFTREVKPLISEVFDGRNASVIAYGARGSGKTYTIQGCDENSGLAAMAIDEILLGAKKYEKSVTISAYEVYQDHVYDILNPKKREVLVLENRQGKIQLKGLSRVPVNSVSEFHKLYNTCSSQKLPQKISFEASRRSHRGLMVHVSSCDVNSRTVLVGKMNFVDLAGYEDVRRRSGAGPNIADSSINKTLFALQNVVHALKTGGLHVPYRESKLTRMLQGSFGGANRILMVACLNPTFCQDTISIMNHASRSYQGINRTSSCPLKIAKCSTRPTFTSSLNITKSSTRPALLSLSKNGRTLSASTSFRKQASSQVKCSEKITNGKRYAGNQRKLANHSTVSEKTPLSLDNLNAKANLFQEIALAAEPSPLEEVNLSTDIASDSNPKPSQQEEGEDFQEASKSELPHDMPLEEELQLATLSTELESSSAAETETSIPAASTETRVLSKDAFLNSEPLEVTPSCNAKIMEVFEGEKEKGTGLNGVSPPISTRLRELSNNLKSLYSGTPLRINLPLENDSLSNIKESTVLVEPKTPVFEQKLGLKDKSVLANTKSPWQTFSARSAGMKSSLVQDCMKFINSASKEELQKLQGIGEKRASYILQLRENSPEPFKDLDDLKGIGLSEKQIKGMMRRVAGDLFC